MDEKEIEKEETASMSAWERETIINMNTEEKEANIYSCDSRIWQRCEKLGLKAKDIRKTKEGKVISKEYKCPKRWIKIKKPREISEERKKILVEQLRRSK